MSALTSIFGSPLPLWLALAFGAAGAVFALAGSLLRGRFQPGARRAGACLCVLGLALMTVGLFCLASRLSTSTPA